MTQVQEASQEEAQENHQMRSVQYYMKLSPAKQLAMLKEAKGGSWYDGWKPYCGTCSTMRRMESKNYGFHCTCCGNQIGFDLYRVLESPLNKKAA